MSRGTRSLIGLVSTALLAVGCASPSADTGAGPSPTSSGTGTLTPSRTPPPAAPTTSTSPTAQQAEEIGGLPTDAELAAAMQEVSRLPLRGLAGQVVVASYDGQDPSAGVALVRSLGLAGVIVLPGNVPGRPDARAATMRSLSAGAQAAVRDSGRGWPALLGVDQEGGPVARLRAPLTEFPSAMAIGASGSTAMAYDVGRASAEELKALGFTMVFAPDADVTSGRDAVIGIRSLSSDPAAVATLATSLARGYADGGVVPVVKHFPGHGSLDTDSHVDRPTQSSSEAELAARDLVPFAHLVAHGVPAVMAGHIVATAIDPSAPATLSAPVLTGVLRGRLGFRGLVVTDSMQMGAVRGLAPAGTLAVRAVAAGVDLVLMPTDPAAAVAGLAAAVEAGTLRRERLVEAAARVVATLRHQAARPAPAAAGGPTAAPGASQATADRLAAASLVQLGGCDQRLVGAAVTITGGDAADRSAFAAAAGAAGLGVGGGTPVALVGGTTWYAGLRQSSIARTASAPVVVATDNPTYLNYATASVAKIATFGRTPATWAALVAVLQGRAKARGRLPVAIDGAPLGSGCS